jgi:hypothetical protein
VVFNDDRLKTVTDVEQSTQERVQQTRIAVSLKTQVHPMQRWIRVTAALALTSACIGNVAAEKADDAAVPLYKPSSNSSVAVNILSPGYGASRQAANAISLGTIAPDFTLRRAGGGRVSLAQELSKGPAAIIFYRGHW